MTYVLVEQIHVRAREVADTAALCALCHIQGETFGLDSAILICRCVIICEAHRWNLILARIARNSDEVIDHASLKTAAGELCLVGHLGVIAVEVLGEVDNGFLNEFQVTDSAYYNSESEGVVGLHRLVVELGRDIELTHTA